MNAASGEGPPVSWRCSLRLAFFTPLYFSDFVDLGTARSLNLHDGAFGFAEAIPQDWIVNPDLGASMPRDWCKPTAQPAAKKGTGMVLQGKSSRFGAHYEVPAESPAARSASSKGPRYSS
jgi:hypothetical protein